jgi:hypothetical protein
MQLGYAKGAEASGTSRQGKVWLWVLKMLAKCSHSVCLAVLTGADDCIPQS